MEFSIDRLAALTRLSLDKEEKKRLESDLAGILAYVGQLREVDTDGVDEITHAHLDSTARQAAPEMNRLRADAPSGKGEEEKAVTVAVLRDAFPESEEGYLRVPLVIKK